MNALATQNVVTLVLHHRTSSYIIVRNLSFSSFLKRRWCLNEQNKNWNYLLAKDLKGTFSGVSAVTAVFHFSTAHRKTGLPRTPVVLLHSQRSTVTYSWAKLPKPPLSFPKGCVSGETSGNPALISLFSFHSPTFNQPGPLCSSPPAGTSDTCIQIPQQREEGQARTQPRTPQSICETIRATPDQGHLTPPAFPAQCRPSSFFNSYHGSLPPQLIKFHLVKYCFHPFIFYLWLLDFFLISLSTAGIVTNALKPFSRSQLDSFSLYGHSRPSAALIPALPPPWGPFCFALRLLLYTRWPPCRGPESKRLTFHLS